MSRTAVTWLAVLLVQVGPPAHSLKLHSRRNGRLPVPDAGHSAASFQSVPSLDVFRERWEEFSRTGLGGMPHVKARMVHRTPGQVEVRMVVGIFSRLDHEDEGYRDVIRSTWMKQRGVCTLDQLLKDYTQCRILATFVLGNRMAVELGRERLERHNRTGKAYNESDLTVLDVQENMNCGKTRAWFQYAAEKYKAWATHVAKMDMDAYVDVAMLGSALQDYPRDCSNVYGGRPWACPFPEYCPPEDCGRPLNADFWIYMTSSNRCWTYMQGGFYFMTRQMAQEIAAPGGWWARHDANCHPEDAMVGKAVSAWGKNNTMGVDVWGRPRKTCVSVMDLLHRAAIWHADQEWSWDRPALPPLSP